MKKVKLILSGSGTRFPVFIGALRRLEEAGIGIGEVCGTSGGALVAAGLASGYSVLAMERIALQLLPNFRKLVSFSFLRLFRHWGLINGDRIEQELEGIFVKSFKNTEIPLNVVVVNYDRITRDIPYTVFCTNQHPDMSVSKAVMASMSIPIIFQPVVIDGDRYIDGGAGSNFPIDFYGLDTDNVIGLCLSWSGMSIKPNDKTGIFGFIRYLLDILNILMKSSDIEENKIGKTRVIQLKTQYSSLNFFLKTDDIRAMIAEGYQQADAALANMK